METETLGIGGTIRLGQFLKYANIAESGAHAKEILEKGLVAVDGQPEMRRGRQLHGGELVEIGDPVWARIQVQVNSW